MRLVYRLILGLYLLVVGLWPGAATPIGLAATGATVVVGQLPILLLAAAAVWLYLRYRPSRPAAA